MTRQKIPEEERAAFRSAHLDRFKYATRGRRGTSPAVLEKENDWWALGQHHGLATPLLDWTESPFVAAFFAFTGEGSPQTERRAIWALSRPDVEAKSKELHDTAYKKEMARADGDGERLSYSAMQEAWEQTKEVEFFRPQSDENPRLVNQAGLFTRVPDNTTLDEWVSLHYPGQAEERPLVKITIPNTDRADCLRSLNRMNISLLTLWPDLQGASEFCNLHCEIPEY